MYLDCALSILKPQVTLPLLKSCGPILDLISKKVEPKPKYRLVWELLHFWILFFIVLCHTIYMYHVLSMSYTYKRCCIYRLNRHIDQTLIKTGHNVPRFILGASAKCLLSRSKLSSILGNNNMLSRVYEDKHD